MDVAGRFRLPGPAWLLLLVLLAGCRAPGATRQVWQPVRPSRGGEDVRHALLSTAAAPARSREEELDAWALENIETGDIVFLRCFVPVLAGTVDLARITATLTRSPYSHTGIASVEQERVWVYDTTRKTGPRRIPFSAYVMQDGLAFGVKRLTPEYRPAIPEAIAYCREVHQKQIPFDRALQLGAERLYCTELTEAAFRSAGIVISSPVTIDELPGYAEMPLSLRMVQSVSPLRRNPPVYIPGNESIGLWASDKLELVYEADSPQRIIPGRSKVQHAVALDAQGTN